jgi:hypothetical protein
MLREALVTEEVIARQPPEAQAVIRMLMATIAELDGRVAEPKARLNQPPASRRCRRRASIRTPTRRLGGRRTARNRGVNPVMPSTRGRCFPSSNARRSCR